MKAKTPGSEKTRRQILDALKRILLEKGFRGVGINAIAREAGIDKVLIYRYFGSLEGLLATFREEEQICPIFADIVDKFPRDAKLSAVLSSAVLELFKSFRQSSLIQEITRWELAESNPLTKSFIQGIEKKQMDALAEKGIFPDRETVLGVAIIIAGLHFISLKQKHGTPMMNLELSNPETVRELEDAATELIKGYLAGRDEVPYVN